MLTWAQAVHQLDDEALAWGAEHATPTTAERAARYDDLFNRVCTSGQQHALESGYPCQTLARRVSRHQDELFQFVLILGVPPGNNLAERCLRPLVIIRKISGGSRSPQGSKTHLNLFSLLSAWAARVLDLLFSPCGSAPLPHRQRPTLNCFALTLNDCVWPGTQTLISQPKSLDTSREAYAISRRRQKEPEHSGNCWCIGTARTGISPRVNKTLCCTCGAIPGASGKCLESPSARTSYRKPARASLASARLLFRSATTVTS